MDVDNPKEIVTPVDIGALLVEARDNLGLNSKNIADQLNLAIDIIQKIEESDFEQDIPVAFIRGYVKSYATKVGLDTGPLLSEFDKLAGVDSPSLKRVESISRFDKKRKELNSSHYLFKVVSALILVAFLSFASWEVWKRYLAPNISPDAQNIDISGQLDLDNQQADLDKDEPLIAQADTDKTASEVPDSFSNDSVDTQEEPLDNQQKLENNKQSEPDTSAQEAASQSPLLADTSNLIMTNLVLDFSADCWVRIVDARGEVIALGVKNAGKHMPLEGVAPFSVVLGDPSVVTMIYADRDYDLTGYRAGRRAEIVLN